MKNQVKFCCFLTLTLFLTSCKKEVPDPPIVSTAAVNEISYTTATAGGNVTSDYDNSIFIINYPGNKLTGLAIRCVKD